MERALIVSHSEKSISAFTDILNAMSCNKIVVSSTCGEARRLLLDNDFDLCIINSPLPDETGESLARHIAAQGISQVILVVRTEYYEEVSAIVEDSGVLTVSKPINRSLLWNTLKLAKAAHKNLRRVQTENTKLMQRIEDIRIVDRAKCVLISCMNLSEPEAHKLIEKRAMDSRATKRAVAEEILRSYEN